MNSLMSQSGLSLFSLAALLLGVVFVLQWVWRRPLAKDAFSDGTSDSGESEVTARAIMTPEESTLFNLVRLAAQDYFLVLVKMPILQVISVTDNDEEARKALMRRIQSARLDVVLAHPGTLQTVTVIHFQKNEEQQHRIEKRAQIVDTVLKAANITVVRLQVNQSYSVEQVVQILGLADDE